QLEKGDSLTKGYTSELWDFTCINVTQNNLQELKEIWAQWDDEVRRLFYCNYGDLPYLLDINVDQLDRRVTPVPAILAETFRSLSACRRTGEGRFIGCAQLLLVWFHSHFWKMDKVSSKVFSENYYPLKELAATLRRDDITEERWMAIFQNLRDEDVEWKALWMVPDEILYRYGDFDWVPLFKIWGAIGYTPLLVLRQYRSRQFILATQGLVECEFSYRGNNYKGKIREMSNAWKQIHRMKRFTVGATTTLEYHGWRSKRINDNIPEPNHEKSQSIEEHLRVV
ncbi:hypothetical protein Gotur_035330, partial [Gossypium turneri]